MIKLPQVFYCNSSSLKNRHIGDDSSHLTLGTWNLDSLEKYVGLCKSLYLIYWEEKGFFAEMPSWTLIWGWKKLTLSRGMPFLHLLRRESGISSSKENVWLLEYFSSNLALCLCFSILRLNFLVFYLNF